MADELLTNLPVLSDVSGSVFYAVKGGTDYQVAIGDIQGSTQPQAANLVYAGPVTPPGDFPEFRPLVIADIPDLSSLYLASTGGSLSSATINNSNIVGGTISGATATFDDDKFTVRDQTDTTKRMKFELSGVTAGATRTLTVPDETTTIVGTTTSQTLTNKILRTVSGTTGSAPLRVPHGSAPTSPVNGDIWTTTAGLYVRVNNSTVGPMAAATSSTVNSFNGRVGSVTLTSTDVINALGFTPANAATAAVDADVVHTSWTISAGNGLTGGGSGAANRTITLGTPSTITESTSNTVTTTSHTHALSSTLQAWGSFDPSTAGLNSLLPNNQSDLNNVAGNPSTFFRYVAAAGNNPTSNGGVGWWVPYQSDFGGQFAHATSLDRVFFRGLSSGSWGSWKELLTAVNLDITGTTGARTITNTAGTNAVIPVATASVSGLVSTGNQTFGGTKTATNWVATSDANLKKDIKEIAPRRIDALLRFVSFIWKDTEEEDLGVIAQEVQRVAPEYVYEDKDTGMLAVDKASLALEIVMSLAERVRYLESMNAPADKW